MKEDCDSYLFDGFCHVLMPNMPLQSVPRFGASPADTLLTVQASIGPGRIVMNLVA